MGVISGRIRFRGQSKQISELGGEGLFLRDVVCKCVEVVTQIFQRRQLGGFVKDFA